MDAEIFTHGSQYFAELGASQGVKGPIGELTAHLASGQTDREFFYAVVDRYGLERETWFRSQRLDLVLGYAKHCLDEHELLRSERIEYMRALNKLLQVSDGEYLSHRPSEVAQILREQLAEVLSDEMIESHEDIYLGSLQSLFGLGYDDFLSLTRVTLENSWADLQHKLRRDDVDQNALGIKIKLLEPIVRLATMQRRSLGAMNS